MVKVAERTDLSFNFMEAFNDICIGAYEVLDRLDDVPLNIPESDSVTYDVQVMLDGMGKNPGNSISQIAFQSGGVGSYFDKPRDHMYTPLLRTPEERQEHAAKGVKYIEEFISVLDLPKVVNTLKDLDEYTQNVSLPRFPWVK